MSRNSRHIKSLIECASSHRPSKQFDESERDVKSPNQDENVASLDEPELTMRSTSEVPSPHQLLKRVSKMTILADADKLVIGKLQVIDYAHIMSILV